MITLILNQLAIKLFLKKYKEYLMKLNLPNITLIAIDCVDLERVVFAAKESIKHCNFGSVKILTHLDYSNFKCNEIEFISIPFQKTIYEYCSFVVRHLNNYVNTDFALMFQWDGFVLNPNAWTNLFLNYDYIGAIWNQNPWAVGNGGFSLRSKRLLKWGSKIPLHINVFPEDRFVSNMARQLGNLAPPAAAALFSTESMYIGSFGFHNYMLSSFETWHKDLKNKKEKKELVAVHSGDAGDIIYCIPTIRKLNIDKLILNARPDYDTHTGWEGCKALKPLLENEGIKTEIQYGFNPIEVDINFDKWRLAGYDLNNIHLAISQAQFARAEINLYDKFISIMEPKKIARIVINKTARYNNPDFNWQYLLSGINEPIAFIGTFAEFKTFERKIQNEHIFHFPTNNYLEAAQVIAGSKVFIGNQSSCLAIANGLKCKRILEVYSECPNSSAYDKNGNALEVHDFNDLIKAKHKLYEWLNVTNQIYYNIIENIIDGQQTSKIA